MNQVVGMGIHAPIVGVFNSRVGNLDGSILAPAVALASSALGQRHTRSRENDCHRRRQYYAPHVSLLLKSENQPKYYRRGGKLMRARKSFLKQKRADITVLFTLSF